MKEIEYEDGYPVAFTCPYCNTWNDLRITPREEFTVGGLSKLPHVKCTNCNKCVGCYW